MPTLQAGASPGVIVAQTRGCDFVDATIAAKGVYEIDTIQHDGQVTTASVQLDGALCEIARVLL